MSLLAGTEWWRPAPAGEARVEPRLAAVPPAERGTGVIAFRALMAFMFILLLAPQNYLPALQPFRIALLAAVVGISAAVADSLLHGGALTIGGREMVITAGLVAWAAITLPLSYWPGGSAAFLFGFYFKTVAIFWLLANAVDRLPRLRTAAWALTGMAVPLALTGVKNYVLDEFGEGVFVVKRIGGYDSALTQNPNDLALMLNMILPLSVALLLSARSALARAVLLAAVALQVAGVVVTFSRGGFITLATVFVLYVWRLVARRRVGLAVAALALALAGLAVLPAGYLARLATITNIDTDITGSAQTRWSDSGAALGFVLDHPLIGGGLGMNMLALNEVRGPTWTPVHNVYLEYGMDLGLPGLVLFLLLMGACILKARGVRRRSETGRALSELSWLAGGIEIALLAFAVAAFFHPVAYHLYFYLVAGLAVAAGRIHRKLAAVGESERWVS